MTAGRPRLVVVQVGIGGCGVGSFLAGRFLAFGLLDFGAVDFGLVDFGVVDLGFVIVWHAGNPSNGAHPDPRSSWAHPLLRSALASADISCATRLKADVCRIPAQHIRKARQFSW